MFKKQKSKILVFLLMLGLLYGCKRQILDPLNPQNNLPQKANFDKVKGFYENGRYKNQPKRTSGNERMTAQDSARFKDFEPQWDKTEVELLPNNEKMLIVPVLRFLNVEYNQNIGFIRRLCIRVDANEDFLEANIVELVGNLNFVKSNHNAIFKNYKENSVVIGFEGTVIVYQLDYDVETAKFYSGGVFQRNTAMQTQRVSTCVVIGSTYISGWSCGNANDPWHATATNCPACTSGYWQSSYSFVECFVSGGGGNSSGGNTGVSGGPSGNPRGGSSGGSGGYIPTDPGVSWDDDGTPRTLDGLPTRTAVVTGAVYQDLKDYVTDSKIVLDSALLPASAAFLDPTQKIAIQNMQAGMTQTKGIMVKIETNTKNVDLEVVTDASLTDAAYVRYDTLNKRLQIRSSPKPVQVANPTAKQIDAFNDSLQKYYANLAHELKHVEQFLDGLLSFNKISGLAGELHDVWDEIAGYNLYFLMIGEVNISYTTPDQIKTIITYANTSTTNNTITTVGEAALTADIYIKP